MKLHELAPAEGSRKSRKRVGRGPGSGMGKTSTRGHKGHKARSGGGVRPGFEGGQMPLHRRLPKRGFTSLFKKKVGIVNISDLDRFDEGAQVDEAALRAMGLVKGQLDAVKVLGNGEIKKSLEKIKIKLLEGIRGLKKQEISARRYSIPGKNYPPSHPEPISFDKLRMFKFKILKNLSKLQKHSQIPQNFKKTSENYLKKLLKNLYKLY